MKFAKNILANSRPTITTALFFAAVFTLAFNPLALSYDIGTLTFDRVFGEATLYGIDASLRARLFAFFNVVFVPICIAAGLLVCHLFVRKAVCEKPDENTDRALSFLNKISLCSLALAIVCILNKYNIAVESGVGAVVGDLIQKHSILALPLIISLATLVYVRQPFLPFEVFRSGIYLSFGLSLFVSFILQSPETEMIDSLLRFYVIFAVVIVLVLFALGSKKTLDIGRLNFSFVPLSFGMLFAGLALEFCNILNQHEIFIVQRLLAAKLVYCSLLGLSVLLFLFARSRFLAKLRAFAHRETIALIGLLVSLYYFTMIPALNISADSSEAELFEGANHGMLVNDALAWGKIPIVNSFDGHMLMKSLGRLVYGWLNGDVLGASYFDYSFVWALPTTICLFFIYKNVFGKDFAFFFMLIAPSVSVLGVRFGVISVIALIYAARKRTFGAYLWLLFSVVLSAIYEAPTGVSYGGGALLIAIALLIAQAVRERKFMLEARNFAKAFGVFVGVMGVLWCGLCLFQDVDPLKRALEFISIAQSMNVWAYQTIGDNTSILFGLGYSILPIIAVCCLAWLVVKFKNTPAHLASCAFLLAYIINFITRALGRHSLAESNLATVMWTAVLGTALFAVAVLPKRKFVAFIAVGVFVASAVFDIGAVYNSNSVANEAIITANNPETYYNGAKREKTARVDLSSPSEQWKNVLNMIGSVIPQDETYMDLSNGTMLYALSGREKPVYINQSPLHLSDEYSQTRFIEEVENFDGACDFALLYDGFFSPGFSGGLGGVSQSYRCYYVYEYMYENFRPLCKSSDNFALWVRKDRYNEFSRELYANIATPIDYGYLGTVHETNLGQIPYAWGTYDSKKSWENPLIKKYSADSGEIPADVQAQAKYVCISIDAATDGNASLAFQDSDGSNISIFNFSLLAEQNRYMIRVSADWWWNSGKIVSFALGTDVKTNLQSVEFVMGD